MHLLSRLWLNCSSSRARMQVPITDLRPVAVAIVGSTDRASPAAAGYCAFADGLALRRPKTAKPRCEQH
jgi:hypothetical protein